VTKSTDYSGEYLYLTTTGRKTGKPREIEIWFVEREGRLYVLTEFPERSNWYRNIIADPSVIVRIGKRRWAATGRLLVLEVEETLYREVQDQCREKYDWGDGTPVELELGEELP
jgi:deazaflavin-dependent oxidoreductase (nitroreductase family)